MPRKKTTPWESRKTDTNSEPRLFTKLTKLFLCNLHLFSLHEIAAYLVIAEATTGHHIDSKAISVRDVAKGIVEKAEDKDVKKKLMDKDTAQRAMNSLELKGWIRSIGVGPRRTRIYKIVLLESLNDLKPVKAIPKLSDLPKKRKKLNSLDNEKGTVCPPTGDKLYLHKKVQLSPQTGQSLSPQTGQSVPSLHYIKKRKETTTSLPLSKIPKKLIDAFPSELRIKPILKITAEGLAGKGMPEREPEFIQIEIEWLLKYIKTHEVKNLTGLYRTALIEGYGNDAKLLPEIQKPGTQDPQKIIDQNLAEQTKLDKQRQADEAKIQLSENIQALIDSLPSDEHARLKSIAIDSMSKGDKALYMRTNSKFTLNRCMRKVYDKLYEKV